MSRAPIRILVVDDQRLVRTGLRVILDTEPDLQVIGEAANGSEAVRLNRALGPDVVLMDIRMPEMDGLEATRAILAQSAARVVILTTFDADEYVYEALRAGASGFLLKDAEAQQLLGCVRAAANGDAVIDPSVTRRLLDRFATAARPASTAPPELAVLTPREQDVFRLVCRGLTNSEISTELFVEETTVKTHLGRILAKLGVRDRVQAVILGYQTGFVAPE
jgi:DNA-binding NarL/FixJ family response regulator